jgi:alpha-1,3-mannosyltransferase
MRVVHVVRQFHPSIGGLEDTVMNVAAFQRAELGLDARVVTLNRLFTDRSRKLPAQEMANHIPVRRIGWTGSSRYPVAPRVLTHVRDADILHVHGIDFFFDYLALTRGIHRKPMVASTHGGFFHTPFLRRTKQVYFHSITRRLMSAYDAIIASSDQDAEVFATIGGSRVVTIESGADLGKFGDCAASDPARCLIYFGRLASHKRIGDLFALLAALRRRHGTWRLIIAGSPGEVRWSDLDAEAGRQSVTEAVRFLRSPTNDELRKELRGSSYYASASAHEGFGVAAIEALSAGLVPVLSDIPPFRKLLGKAGYGLTIKRDDPEDTAERLERFHTEFTTQPRAVRRRLMQAASEYDWSTVARRYAGLYECCGHRLKQAGEQVGIRCGFISGRAPEDL